MAATTNELLAQRFEYLNDIEEAEAALLEAEKIEGDEAPMWKARIALSQANIRMEMLEIATAEASLQKLGAAHEAEH